ncbi:MAG TPA: hypothetical protein VMV09_03325, partial [Candidatus Saccharimonadales bacterium]|nr:hypothetical protein [Candidatus Saccharimonadales bacterium]
MSRINPRGRRMQLGAGLLAALAFGTALGYGLHTGAWTATGTARRYLAALSHGDAAAAWAEMEVTSPPMADLSLVSQASLAAALRTGQELGGKISVGTTLVSGRDTIVDASVDGHPLQLFLARGPALARRSFLPRWMILVRPVVVTVARLVASQPLSIDGQLVQARPGKPTIVAVLPLRHVVTLGGTAMLRAQSQIFDIEPTLSSAEMGFVPKFTAAGEAAAIAAVRSAFANCTASSEPAPAGCPQALTSLPSSVTWHLIGDPTNGMTFTLDSQGRFVAEGNYQMAASYGPSPLRAAGQSTLTGSYAAVLQVHGGSVDVTAINAAAGIRTTLPEPTANQEQQGLQIVAQALSACAAQRVIDPPNCPQADWRAVGNVANVHWTLHGDPLIGAMMTFESQNSIYQVDGPLDMTVSYDL